MSFWPFPKILLDELRRGAASGRAVEVGAGDRGLTARMGEAGFELTTLDRRGSADVRGDVRALPLRSRACGLVVMGNLMRHVPAPDRPVALAEFERVLSEAGRGAIFEDLPDARDAAEANYRRALDLLRSADPQRGGTLDLARLTPLLPDGLGPIVDLVVENEERVVDPTRPLAWLESRGYGSDPEFRRLADSVRRHGMQYGRYRVWVIARVSADGTAVAT